MPFFDISETSLTLRCIDRLRDLLTISSHLIGSYAGRAYRGNILAWHDMQGVSEAESPLLVVPSTTRRTTPGTGGGPGVGQVNRRVSISLVTLVHVPKSPSASVVEAAYRESVRLTDAAEKALVTVESDPTGGGGQLWHSMEWIQPGTRTYRLEGSPVFISETIIAVNVRERK